MSNDEYRGPMVSRANAADRSSQPMTRGDLERHAEGFSGRRNLYDALGYEKTSELSFVNYWGRYQRDGLATALIDRYVDSTWQSPPVATPGTDNEGEASVDESSGFSTDVAALFSGSALRQPFGTSLRRSVPEAISLADVYATLGDYSLLFLGFSDGADLDDPLEQGSFSDESEMGDVLAYVTPVSQPQVNDIDPVDDRADRRHRLPETYEIQFDSKGSAETVHHSRVIHIPEGTRVSPIKGTPFLLKGWNRFDDIEKLLGGSAEQAWRGAYNGMAVQPPRDADGNIITFDDDGDDLEEQVKEYRHNMRRVITSTGEIETLDPNVADVSNHIEMHFRAISAAYDIPQSIYMGNETGERATTEDRAQWAETIAGRRNNYGGPRIARPFLDRLDYAGALDAPDVYTLTWQSLTEISDQEWADLMQTKAQAIDLLSAGQPDMLFSAQERRKILGYPEERGSMTASPDDDEQFDDEGDPAAEIDEDQAVGFGDNQQANGGENL